MTTIETKYDKGDKLYTIYGRNPEFVKKIQKIKVSHVGYDENGIAYFYESATGYYKEKGIPEHEIIGKTKQDVRIFINNRFDKLINDLELKRNELLKQIK